MRPSRWRVTTSPALGSSGRAWARGSRTSTPPCMMGAVIMKMMSSTNATSTSDVTLMSAFKGSSPWPRSPPPPPPSAPATLQPPFARHAADDLLGEPFELAGEQSQAVHEDVVGHHRRHGDRQAGDGGDERLGHAGRHGRDVAPPAEGDADEGVHHAEHGPQESQERAHRAERGEPRQGARRQVPPSPPPPGQTP